MYDVISLWVLVCFVPDVEGFAKSCTSRAICERPVLAWGGRVQGPISGFTLAHLFKGQRSHIKEP